MNLNIKEILLKIKPAKSQQESGQQDSQPVKKANEVKSFKVTTNKILGIIIVLLMLLVAYVALVLLSTDSNQDALVNTTPIQAPSSPKTTIAPSELEKEVDNYINSLSTIGSYNQDLKPPKLQLNVTF